MNIHEVIQKLSAVAESIPLQTPNRERLEECIDTLEAYATFHDSLDDYYNDLKIETGE